MAFPADPLIFDQVRDHLAVARDFNWTAGTVRAVLLYRSTIWVPNASDGYVGSALGAGAVETSGVRVTLANPTAALSGADHCVYWDADPITYSGTTVGQNFDTLVLYRFVTNDSDSYLISAYALGAQVGDGGQIVLTPNTNGYVKV